MRVRDNRDYNVVEGYVQVGLGGADKGSEFTLVLALDVLDDKDSSGLLVDDRAETSLALDDDVGDTHLAAESREEHDELNGVDVLVVVTAVGSRPEPSLSRFTASQYSIIARC